MKIFLTGGTGFIGSHFINAAHAAGHHVIALRRNASSAVIALDREPDWFTGELGDDLSQCMSDSDALVHLASSGVSPKPADWESCIQFNVLSSTLLIERAISAGINNFVVAGSFAEYGNAGLRYDYIPADSPLEPIGPYASSKAAASVAISGLCRQAGVKLSYLRIFSAFGEGQYCENLWPSLRRAALSGEDFSMTPGEQIRDFIPVENVADEIVAAIDDNQIRDESILFRNVGSGEAKSILAFSSHYWKEWGAKGELKVGALPYRDNEVMRFVPDVSAKLG